MKISDIMIDTDAVENGAWIGEIPDMPGLELHVRGSECTKARELRLKEIGNFGRRRMSPAESAARAEALQTLILKDVILLGWRGLDDGDEPLQFTPELAKEMIEDPRYAMFRLAVSWASEQVGKSAWARG